MSLGLAMKAMRTEMHKSEMQIYLSRTKHTANGKNASGKTKNNFTEELFQLFLHACKRLKGKASNARTVRGNRKREKSEQTEMKAKDSSASLSPLFS